MCLRNDLVMQVPSLVAKLRAHADNSEFAFSCENGVGQLLAVLSASVRQGGGILEIGTGMGVGLGWIVSGLGQRDDVSVTTIELDSDRSSLVSAATDWPSWVEFVVGEATVELARLGSFDLVFADAEGGKWYGLGETLSSLAPGGMLLLDDLVPQEWRTEAEQATHREKMQQVRERIYSDASFAAMEMDYATGVLLAVRKG